MNLGKNKGIFGGDSDPSVAKTIWVGETLDFFKVSRFLG
jgi:hypothetical protein